jgi:hypothetical protein
MHFLPGLGGHIPQDVAIMRGSNAAAATATAAVIDDHEQVVMTKPAATAATATTTAAATAMVTGTVMTTKTSIKQQSTKCNSERNVLNGGYIAVLGGSYWSQELVLRVPSREIILRRSICFKLTNECWKTFSENYGES